jgi:hypothetical protein
MTCDVKGRATFGQASFKTYPRLVLPIRVRAPATAIAFAWWDEPMSYWACARLEPHRERVALHCLELNGFKVYLPRLREHRTSYGRKIEIRPLLLPISGSGHP